MNLIEDKRTDLIAQGRKGEREKTDGKTRYEKRLKSRFSSSTREFNQIDMNEFFKNNILTVGVPVTGETSNYIVTMSFGNILDIIQRQVERANGILDLRTIVRSLITAFNSDNVYIRCTCPDWQYRMGYWASVNKIIVGSKENRPSKITNPGNKLGPGCKHVMLVLSNTGWLIKVASVINNYIKYMERSQKRLYADIIYPAIYGKEYTDPVQLQIDDTSDELDTSKETIDTSNIQGAVSGRFKPGNPYRFTKKESPNKNQIGIEDNEQDNQ